MSKLKRSGVVFVLSLIPFTGHSAGLSTGQSDFFYQLRESELLVAPSVGYSTRKTQFTESTTRSSGITGGLNLRGGLSDSLEAGVELFYSDRSANYSKSGNSDSQSGLGDIGLSLRGQAPMSVGTLRYAFFPTISPERATYNLESRRSNNFSGGHTLGLAVGWDNASEGSLCYGAVAQYTHYLERTTAYTDGTKMFERGGDLQKLEAFLEHDFRAFNLGSALAVLHTSSGKYRFSDGSTPGAFGGTYMLRPTLYSTLAVARSLDATFEVWHSFSIASDNGNYRGIASTGSTVGVRTLF